MAKKKKSKSNGKAQMPRTADDAAAPTLHLLKLCVGVGDIAELADWQKKRRKQFKRRWNWHRTRNYPRRDRELLQGGSLYWVIAGSIRVRQRIIGVIRRPDEDGVPCCELRLDPKLVETTPRAHRPFQGWRYFDAKDAPPDLTRGGKPRGDRLPPALAEELRALGLL